MSFSVTFIFFLLLFLPNFLHGCDRFADFETPSLSRRGDVTIGGIFPIFNKEIGSVSSFREKPGGVKCAGFDLRAFRWTQVMIFAIEEINEDPMLLPNVTLGYRILNSCASPTNTLRAALALASGPTESESGSGSGSGSGSRSGSCPPAVSALIAESGSSQSLAVAGVLGPFQVPIVSYFSTCACLSDRTKFPTFFRTIPSDFFQAKALAALVRRFGWRWIGAVQSDNDYGRNGVLAFQREVEKFGVCVAFVGTVLRTYPKDRILDVVETIKSSTVKVVLAFVPEGDFYPLMVEIVRQNVTGIQWIASEAWITASRPSTPEMYRAFGGALGFVVQKMAIPDLRPFLTKISPYADPKAPFVGEFWETMVGCSPGSPGSAGERVTAPCEGNETLADSKDVFFNVSQLRVAYNVYKAVYAIANAVHQLLGCNTDKRRCGNVSQIKLKEVTARLQEVNFVNKFGDRVFFDARGDPPATYDVINWQLADGGVQHVTVGHYGGHDLSIREDDIVWRTGTTVPVSVCSEVCPPGSRKAQIKGKPTCCFDCVPCAEGTVSNTSGAADCSPCPLAFWSNAARDVCVPKAVEFLSYGEPLGVAAAAVSLLGAASALATLVLFRRLRHTPVIKASNAEMSYFLLASLFLCFLCPLTFVGRPTAATCALRHTAFGVTFALAVSCVLGKTVVVVAAFKASFPGGNRLAGKLLTPQRLIVGGCTLVQVAVCVLWLRLNPPFPDRVHRHGNRKVVLECNTGSPAAFYAVLGYIGVLALVCLALAFAARKLPDDFNEAKFIAFSMLIFCAVWIAFIPAYVSSPGKYAVAVEIFAILASAFGLLICIFAPKCYIILIKPEKNTKRRVTTAKTGFQI